MAAGSVESSLPLIPGGWTESSVSILDRDFQLWLPARPDDFLDDPLVQQASRDSDYMPYWPILWGSAPTMARLVLEADWRAGTRTLEIGSGIGLVGLAALAAGLDVTFSDYDTTAVQLAVGNARRNGFATADGLVFDWRELDALGDVEPFPVLLGCDVIYEPAIQQPILDVVDRLLAPGGVCWIADPGRSHATAFVEQARQRGYQVACRDESGRPVPTTGSSVAAINQFQLLILS